MKKSKFYLTVLCLLSGISIFAQMEVDHAIQLTGLGTDAKINGIRSVTDSLDVPSVKVVQNGSLIYAVATGNDNNFNITISPPVTGYQAGMVFNFIANQNVNGPATLNVNNLGIVSIKKYINQNLGGCEIQNGQFVTVAYDGTNFQITSVFAGMPPTTAEAGPDQLNLEDTTTSLSGNTAISGTGIWSIVSGTGGSLSNPASATSSFTGRSGQSYILSWAISSCVSSSDSVNISFTPHGAQTFNYTGAQQTFTVPPGITQVTLAVYGAQGGTVSSNVGGEGGSATGTLAVTPGENLYVYVGNQPTNAAGGFNGGGNGYNTGTGGGGASDVRAGGTGVNNRVIVAGGGGGAEYPSWSGTGGTGGGTSGGNAIGGAGGTGSTSYNGSGGTQSAGGSSDQDCGGSTPGSLGQGGTPATCEGTGGGGGGGYYGGGAGSAGAGGGGSGYTGGVANGNMENGVQTGNGQVIISW